MTDIKEFTNRELGIILEDIQRDIKRINHYIEGNGKKGLLDRMNDAEKCMEKTTESVDVLLKAKQATHTRIIDIVWKVGTVMIMTFLGIDKLK